MNHTDLMTAPTPHYAIVINVEGRIHVTCNAMNDSEEQRLNDWVNNQPELRHLLNHALELAERRATHSR